jgi:tetratricopeptide (TPR) repeat protein
MRQLTLPSLSAAAIAFVLVLTLQPQTLAARQHDEHPMPADFDQPIRLYASGLGKFTWPISSRSPEAQAYFNQGFQLMYAFAKPEAGRSFREAQRRDPSCAICYWGEAWAWGSYVNGRMTAQQAPRAYAAIQKALSLSKEHADDKERALIRAMSTRYSATFNPAATRAQDQAYGQAMKAVWQRFPDDPDIATLYAEAAFLLLPRPGALDIKNPGVIEVLRVLEGVLAKDVHHAGACHLYVHTTELTTEPARAEQCVEVLGNAMPGASHINHMPSHTWSKVGRWGDAVRASLQAWQSDQKAAAGGDAFITYPAHDLQMLVFAASMDGQGSVAIQAGSGLARLTRDPMYRGLALVRFGRFAEIPAIGARPSGDLASGMWDFVQGYAQLRKGDVTAARASLDRLVATAGTSKALFKIHPVAVLLHVVGGILDGEIRRGAGDVTGAVTAFEQAVAAEDTLLVDEPEPLPFPARHWLGAGLLQAKRFADAEQVYRTDLARHPKNGWSLRGLQQALDGQRKPSGAVADQFRASWVRADTPIDASRF